MNTFVKEFCKRGLLAAGCGPVILAIIYGILGANGTIVSLTPGKVCLGILTVSLLAFIVAGISVVYQIEKLPLGWSTLLHGFTLYASYIVIYLVNGWLKQQLTAILGFTGIFAAGYAVIWLVIWLTTRRKISRINETLNRQKELPGD